MSNKILKKRYAAGASIMILSFSLCCDTAAAMASVQHHTSPISTYAVQKTVENQTKKEKDPKDNQKYKLSNYIIPKDDQDTSSAITYYLNHPDKVSQEELDAVCLDYLKNTLDMQNMMRVINSLSTETVDQMAEYYIKESKDYRIFDDLKEYLSKKASKKLKKVVKKALSVAVEKGKDCIDEYLKHPEKYSKKKLEEVISAYVKEHKDITVVLKVVDKLGKDSVNQIVKTYLKDTKDWSVLKSFKKYLSKDVFKELTKLMKNDLFGLIK